MSTAPCQAGNIVVPRSHGTGWASDRLQPARDVRGRLIVVVQAENNFVAVGLPTHDRVAHG
jgi:hypothetical protein